MQACFSQVAVSFDAYHFKIRAEKSPETLDAVGIQPTASKVL